MILDLFPTTWEDAWHGIDLDKPVGAVFTKPEIVDLVLDLAGYCPDVGRLATRPLFEPSCGDGAFLEAILRRLIAGEQAHTSQIDWSDPHFDVAIQAVDINLASIKTAQRLVCTTLIAAGCSSSRATELAQRWINQTDFLLANLERRFDFVIGNPPYVRIEDIPKRVLGRYRAAFSTLSDRADIYVAFFQKGLELLSANGVLAFICANRFTKNQYGEALRHLIVQQYHVRHYINLEHTQPFVSDVSAYPSIIVLDRSQGNLTRSATLADISLDTLQTVKTEALAKGTPQAPISQFERWYPNGAPWLTTSSQEYNILERLSDSLPTLEVSAPGTRIGIGVATGADSVFVLKGKHPDIEASRQIPLILPANISNRTITWSEHYLLNPFADADDGSLANLEEYPGLAAYIDTHAAQLKGRHCAKTRPNAWYRTIDRIWPQLQNKPKLVIPDIQGSNIIGLDNGEYYPHHNLYWITSDSWPLAALKTLLRSSIVYQQVKAHSVQMRGGSVRYQAQTLRRIRVPYLKTLAPKVLDRLIEVVETDSQEEIDAIAVEAFAQ